MGARKTVILKKLLFYGICLTGLENKRTYGIQLRLSAVVCFWGEKPCFYALYSKDSETGEIVAVFVVKTIRNSESRHNEHHSLWRVNLYNSARNSINTLSR